MAARFALMGLLIPVIFEVKYAVTGTEILSQSIYVWPASLGLAGLDRSATTQENIVGFIAIATLSNVGLYALDWLVLRW